MASLNTMVKRCAGLVGTGDVSEWEEKFLQNVLRQTSNGDNTSSLTEKQVETLERIHDRHFEG